MKAGDNVADGTRPKRTQASQTDPAAAVRRVNELRSELVELRAELSRERDERAGDAETIGALMARIAGLEAHAAPVSKRGTRRPSATSVRAADERIALADKEIETLAAGLRAAVTRAEQAELQVEAQLRELLRLQSEVEQVRVATGARDEALDAAVRQLEAERLVIQDAEIGLAAAQAEAKRASARASELEAARTELEQERERNDAAMVTLRDELEKRRDAALEARMAVEVEADRANGLTARISVLEAERAQAGSERERLGEELAAARGQIDIERLAVQDAELALVQARDQSSRLAARVGELTPLASGLDTAKTQVMSLKLKLGMQEKAVLQAKEEHAAAVASLTSAHERALAESREAHQRRLGVAEAALEETEAERTRLDGALVAAGAELERVTGEFVAIAKQLDVLRRGLSEITNGAGGVSDLLEELERRDLEARELRARTLAMATSMLEQALALEQVATVPSPDQPTMSQPPVIEPTAPGGDPSQR